MGTRNLTIVVHENKYKLAQYCQWDGYPSGQGAEILEFLLNTLNRTKFLDNLDKCPNVTDEIITKYYEDLGADDSGYVDMSLADRFKELHPSLSRDTGAEVLSFIQHNPVDIYNNLKFAADSLFCEYAYLIDFDKDILEVYFGGNEESLTNEDRFKFLDKNTSQYHPIKLACWWPLNNLPTTKDFVETLEGIEDKNE